MQLTALLIYLHYPIFHLGIDGKIILEWILGKQDGKVWIRCIWLRVGSSGGLL